MSRFSLDGGASATRRSRTSLAFQAASSFTHRALSEAMQHGRAPLPWLRRHWLCSCTMHPDTSSDKMLQPARRCLSNAYTYLNRGSYRSTEMHDVAEESVNILLSMMRPAVLSENLDAVKVADVDQLYA